jgi:cardiolipin synthase
MTDRETATYGAFCSGNRITLCESGQEFFPALLAAIAAAERVIRLETYIFRNDRIGAAVAAALAAAAQRGVAVHLLVDGFGARDFPREFGANLRAAGVNFALYRPLVAGLQLRRNRLRRLHRKLAVIDHRIAFVGGININDDWDHPEDRQQLPPRFDFAVRIEGPLVATVERSMHQLWQLVGWARFRRRQAALPPSEPPVAPGTMAAAFVIRDNLRHRRDIEESYLRAIAAARSEVLIASAYFFPGRRFRLALMAAARRGVAVTVLLQGRVEYALLHYATQALYHRLLAGGVRIVEYHRGFLHAKVAVVDGEWSTVGSSNIDPFSLLLAREANVLVRDAGFAAELRSRLLRATREHGDEIRAADLQRRGTLARALSWLAYVAVRLLIGLTRYGGPDYRE